MPLSALFQQANEMEICFHKIKYTNPAKGTLDFCRSKSGAPQGRDRSDFRNFVATGKKKAPFREGPKYQADLMINCLANENKPDNG